MIQLLRRTLKITAVSVLAVAASASAQTDLRVSVADMKQDLASLLQQVKSLRLEVEQLRAENARLARSQSGERTRSDLLAAIRLSVRLTNRPMKRKSNRFWPK